MWHSKWGKGEAIPCDMTIDLRTLNQLDRMEYMPREDGGNGTLIKGTVSYSTDRQNWSEPVAFDWAKDGKVKTFKFERKPHGTLHQDALERGCWQLCFGSRNDIQGGRHRKCAGRATLTAISALTTTTLPRT